MNAIAVVGLGVIAQYYLAAIEQRDDVALRAACDIDEAKLSALGGIDLLRTTVLSMLLDKDDVELVIVNVPNDAHHDVCSRALRAGKHVCCEKPLALRPSDARDLADLAALRGKTLFTAFHRRYNRGVLDLLTRTRRRGPVRSVRVRYFEHIREHCGNDAWYLDPARCGGGVVADNGPNALDLLRLFLGELRVERALVERDAGGVDVRARLEVSAPAAGASATVDLDWAYPHGELKDIEIITADGIRDSADMLAGFPEFKSSLSHEYLGVVEDFLNHARGTHRPAPNDPDGVELARLVARAYEIAETPFDIRFEEAR